MPLTRRRPAALEGRISAIAARVWSWKTTYGGHAVLAGTGRAPGTQRGHQRVVVGGVGAGRGHAYGPTGAPLFRLEPVRELRHALLAAAAAGRPGTGWAGGGWSGRGVSRSAAHEISEVARAPG